MKNLLRCPTCELNGRKEFLGEINNGTLSVMRHHNSYTQIVGDNLDVYCGKCGEKVYMKRKEDDEREMGNKRGTWFFGQVSVTIPGTIGT
jgi:DNA-directed RNA polymerase subunit RPC12/RpoP